VIPFAGGSAARFIESLGASVTLRRTEEGTVFFTDQKNIILDADFGPIADAAFVAARLNERAGIVEHGLFLGLAADVVVAGADGVRHLQR
jgi:ribose 5-phosphate isomerase A